MQRTFAQAEVQDVFEYFTCIFHFLNGFVNCIPSQAITYRYGSMHIETDAKIANLIKCISDTCMSTDYRLLMYLCIMAPNSGMFGRVDRRCLWNWMKMEVARRWS